MDDKERQQFGECIKRLRIEKRLSLRQVEAEVGISNSYLYQIESGKKNAPRVDVLRKLAVLYGVTLDTLLSAANLGEPEGASLYDDRLIENAFEFVRKDPMFDTGTYMISNTLPIEAKRFIVEMYEKMTGRRLLSTIDPGLNERREPE